MKQIRFYYCKESRSIMLDLGESSSQCRSRDLQLLTLNKSEEFADTHIPVMHFEGGLLKVQVGEKPHSMGPEHYIEWIFVQTVSGGLFHKMYPGDPPKMTMHAKQDSVLGVYTYCKEHGLWASEKN